MVMPLSTKPLVLHSSSVRPPVPRTMSQKRAMPLSGRFAGNDFLLAVCSPCLPTRAGEKMAREPLRLVASDKYHHAESPHRTCRWSTLEAYWTFIPSSLVMTMLVRPFESEVLMSMSTTTVLLDAGLSNLDRVLASRNSG